MDFVTLKALHQCGGEENLHQFATTESRINPDTEILVRRRSDSERLRNHGCGLLVV